MLQITPQMKILVAVEPVDFRKGIDGLAAVCKGSLQQDPFAGTVFVFRNRRATAIKVLVYDGQGFWLCQKNQGQQHPSMFVFPGFRFSSHNCGIGPVEFGFLVRIVPRVDSWRRLMHEDNNASIPPRA